MKLIKRAAAVIAALAVLAGGGVAAPSLASPDTSDGGETRATERAAGIPVGPNLTATWDSTTQTLTVAGYGELKQSDWMRVKHQHCDSASRGPNAAKKIVFAPDGNNRIAFPPDSSFFFSNCRIADIQLPKYGIDVSNVTDMTFMFAKSEVADPDVSEWDTAKVTKMVGMFDTARKANPNVKKWNTSSVTDMTSMFYLAKSAKPEVGDWDTSKVTDFSWMFYNALSANPDVSKWNTGSATHLGAMFWGAKSANPDVSRWDTKNVEYLTFMFERANGCVR